MNIRFFITFFVIVMHMTIMSNRIVVKHLMKLHDAKNTQGVVVLIECDCDKNLADSKKNPEEEDSIEFDDIQYEEIEEDFQQLESQNAMTEQDIENFEF